MSELTIECDVHFSRGGPGAPKQIRQGQSPPNSQERGRVPRVSKLMALAIRFDQLVRDGVVADFAELARLGHVSRARITQIMNLTLLAPEIQEEILFLPRVERGRDVPHMRQLLPIASEPNWRKQRQQWKHLKRTER